MAYETQALAHFICDDEDAVVPVEVAERIRSLMLDNFASGLLGTRQACFRMTADAVIAMSGPGSVDIFGYDEKLDVGRATFLNGVAIGSFEVDHITSGAHAGGAVFPAVLALARSLGSSGAEVVRALAVGYEVNARVAAAQTSAAEEKRGFHNPAISGVFGSAAGCSVLLGLNVRQTVCALGIAGSHAAGLMECVWTGAMTKRIHLGRAAEMGLESALLARQGVTGPPTVLEGRYGFLNAYSPEPKANMLIDQLGLEWVLCKTRVKHFPGHGAIQPFASVLDHWRLKHGDVRKAIDKVHVLTSHQGAQERFLNVAPATLLGAQVSLRFLIGVVLVHGVQGLIELDEEMLSDQHVREVAEKVAVSEDDRFKGSVSSAGGEVHISAGASSDILVAPGLPVPSVADLREISEAKFKQYSAGFLPRSAVRDVVAALDTLEGVGDITDLAAVVFGRISAH